MTSIVELNTLSCNPFTGWHWRMNEARFADDERARDIAQHHFLIAQRYIIGDIRSAIEEHAEYAAMTPAELKLAGARKLGNAADAAFRSFRIMDRLDPAFAAVQKVAGGKLASDLEEARRQVWQVLEAVEAVRKRFYATARGPERQAFNLANELGPLCDTVHERIVAAYRIARELYKLSEMVIDGSVIH